MAINSTVALEGPTDFVELQSKKPVDRQSYILMSQNQFMQLGVMRNLISVKSLSHGKLLVVVKEKYKRKVFGQLKTIDDSSGFFFTSLIIDQLN